MTRKVVSPIALDKSFNTTEQTPRNIADVLAQQLAAIKTAIESGNGNLEAAFVCYYGVTTATQIKEAIEDGKVPYFYYNGSVAQLWKVETDKYTFRTTNTRSVEGQTILDVVDYVVNGSVWSMVTREVSGGSSSGQSYIASVNSLADFDTTGKSGMQDLVSVANVPADGVYQVSVMLHITPKTASATKSDLVLQFTSSDNTGWPSHTFHAVVDDSQTFAQQLSFSTSVSLKAGQNTLRIQCGDLNTEYLVFVDELTVAQLVNGVYHNGDDFSDVHTLPEAPNFNEDDGVLVDGATGGPRFMLWQTLANKVLGFIKNLSTTITAFRTGDYIAVDGTSGTAKMSKDSLCNLLAGYNIGFVGLVGTNMPNVKYTSGTLTIQQSLGYVLSGAEAKYIANINYSGVLGNGTYAIYFNTSDSSVEVANPSPTYFNGENKYLLLGIVRISDGDIFSLVMFGRWKLNNVEQQFEMSKYRSDVATINASIDYLYSSAENLVTATSQYRDITFALKSGQSIRYSITANSYTGFNFSVYLFRSDNTFVECPKVRKIGEEAMYVANEDFIKIRFYNNNGGDGFSSKFQVVGANQIKNEWSYKKALKPLNVLILGDSYSETAGFWRNYFVNYIPQGSSIVCLAVGSASVKDKYTDKVTYPYTSRPTSSDNSGNLNTFACQVEKLKRLMAGVDLDPGESQIYNGTSPDVILIQGGHNDNPDANIDNYFVQYEKQVSGVYIKQKDGKPTELGSCYIKTPMSEVDQTTFAGAYRYLVDELMQLFPSAQIYATTPANLGYWSGSVAQKRYTTSEQIRMVLNLCAVECIDWNRVANISVVRDYPSGSGTSDDPYVWAQGNGEAWADTIDAMHPNSMGARKLGQLTAQKIVDGFFSFNV